MSAGARELSAQLTRWREHAGYNLSTAAELSGVAKGYLSQLERGVHDNPSLLVLCRLAQCYGCSLGALLEADPTPSGHRLNGGLVISPCPLCPPSHIDVEAPAHGA